MWKEEGSTTKLQFSLKGLEILRQERRQVNIIIKEDFNSVYFHPVNKHYTYQSIEYYAQFESHCQY
jgi:hypothetical protein